MIGERDRRRMPGLVSCDVVVADVIGEAPGATTLVLECGARPSYRAGQFLTIDPHQFGGLQSLVRDLEARKGRREPPRAFSLASAPHERTLAITVQQEAYVAGETAYPPLLSGFLARELRAGDRLQVKGFLGGYTVRDDPEPACGYLLHLCAGSGIVPNMSLIKDSLHRHPGLRHTLVYSNRTWADVIFREALHALARRHPERLRVIHALTRDRGPRPSGADVRYGRVPVGLLRDVLAAEPNSIVYMCGPAVSVWQARASAARGLAPPPRFIESMHAHLRDLRVPRERIRVETFG